MNWQQMPREWGKSRFKDLIRMVEAREPLGESTLWVNSRGQIVLDVYLEWDTHGAWVRVDVKRKREGENGYIFRRVNSYPMPEKLHTRDRATALRTYGALEALKLGMPWRPRGKL